MRPMRGRCGASIARPWRKDHARMSGSCVESCLPMSDSRFSSSPPVPRAALVALLGDAASGNPIRRAMWLDELDRRLSPLLPPSLPAHARLANVDGDSLVYLVDSPVWLASLRLASNALLDAARPPGLDVHIGRACGGERMG